MLRALLRARRLAASLESSLDTIKVNQGRILSSEHKRLSSLALKDYEFKVFSQWGEDGILQRLTSIVPLPNKTFIEFGVEDFYEANCRLLMAKDGWRGFVMDSGRRNIAALKSSYFYWMHDLKAVYAFITKDNINQLLLASGFDTDLGILSIDIDGMDYWILDAVVNYRPRILVAEYNALFGPTRKISVPYSADFQRTKAHYSNLYYGASISALAYLAGGRGYSLVGAASAGGNVFFVRDDVMPTELVPIQAERAFVEPLVRESRDRRGRLTYSSLEDRLRQIGGLPVINVQTGRLEEV